MFFFSDRQSKGNHLRNRIETKPTIGARASSAAPSMASRNNIFLTESINDRSNLMVKKIVRQPTPPPSTWYWTGYASYVPSSAD